MVIRKSGNFLDDPIFFRFFFFRSLLDLSKYTTRRNFIRYCLLWEDFLNRKKWLTQIIKVTLFPIFANFVKREKKRKSMYFYKLHFKFYFFIIIIFLLKLYEYQPKWTKHRSNISQEKIQRLINQSYVWIFVQT